MSASVFTYWLWVLNHWHVNEMLAAILEVVAGATAIITKAKLRNELVPGYPYGRCHRTHNRTSYENILIYSTTKTDG